MKKNDFSPFREWLVVIPARLHSTRLPKKMILDLCGKPLIVRVWENLKPLVKEGMRVVVGTDAEEIQKLCKRFSIPSFLCQKEHQSGTDRCFEVSEHFKANYVINVQGDEPFLSYEDLLALIEQKKYLDQGSILTLALRSSSLSSYKDPSVVKLLSEGTKAVGFQRSSSQGFSSFFYHHQGVYAYHRETLSRFCSLPQSPMEKALKLEQMRALENDISIYFVTAREASFGIDTQEDLFRARDIYLSREGKL